jgi:excinuclease Cho
MWHEWVPPNKLSGGMAPITRPLTTIVHVGLCPFQSLPQAQKAAMMPPMRMTDPDIYQYPEHLRQTIGDLPQAPGVYFFHGEGDLPLYIGKSVNIRSRVLAHLRNADEARLLRQTHCISHIRTAGEIGALLLEAQLIKERQPLKNQRLRRNRQLCAWQFQPSQQGHPGNVPVVVSTQEVNFAQAPHLHGLYRSPRAAREGLMQLADDHRLCLGLLGLEKLTPGGRPCFRAMVNKCSGACAGKESAEAHHERLLAAMERLRVACWPYPGAVAIVEEGHGLREHLVVRNWCYLGKAGSLEEARALDQVAAGFDADGYKILCGPIVSGKATVVPLTSPS